MSALTRLRHPSKVLPMWRCLGLRVLVALVVSGVSYPCWADDLDRRIEDLAAQAHADYLTGEYELAARRLLQAYGLRPLPKLLFNAAKAYEKAEEQDKAIEQYRLFLTQADLGDTLVVKARQALERLTPEDPPREVSEPPPPAPAPSRNAAGPTPRGRALAAWGLTAAAFGGGVVLGTLALSKHEAFEQATDIGERIELRDAAQRRALLADISWTVAAAAAVAGILLWPDDDSAPAEVSLRAVPTGASVVGRW